MVHTDGMADGAERGHDVWIKPVLDGVVNGEDVGVEVLVHSEVAVHLLIALKDVALRADLEKGEKDDTLSSSSIGELSKEGTPQRSAKDAGQVPSHEL